MIFQLGKNYRLYPPGSLWTYKGIDVGEHVFTGDFIKVFQGTGPYYVNSEMADGKISWKIPPHLLKFYKIVEDENTERNET